MRFIVTQELGKLARWLRIAGFDTVYYRAQDIGRLAITALRDNRIIVTRNRNIPHLQKCMVIVAASTLPEQLREIKEKLDLPIQTDTMFTRCTLCNAVLEPINKTAAQGKVPVRVYREHHQFMHCPACNKIYWRGSHWGNITEVMVQLALQN